jgi:hypothetical protein
VLGAAFAAFLDPRLGMALALATPVFPLGNHAAGAAVVYGAFAVAWIAVTWRDARRGLLFVAGPLLAPLGALALVPLVVQPVRAPLLRGLQAALAVLSAGFVAAVSGAQLPLTRGSAVSAAVSPGDSAADVASLLGGTLAAHPTLPAAALLAGVTAALLPWIRRRSRYGVAAIGAALVATGVVAGTAAVAVPLLVTVWGVAALLPAGTRR